MVDVESVRSWGAVVIILLASAACLVILAAAAVAAWRAAWVAGPVLDRGPVLAGIGAVTTPTVIALLKLIDRLQVKDTPGVDTKPATAEAEGLFARTWRHLHHN